MTTQLNALKLADEPEQEPTPWRDMVVVSLIREGVNKHRARELADHFAQPKQQAEPIGWLDGSDKLADFMHRDLKRDHDKRGSATPREFTIPVYTTPLPVQEPVAVAVVDEIRISFSDKTVKVAVEINGAIELPQRPWIGLTEQERNDLEDALGETISKPAFDAIEAVLKERNT